MPITTERHEYSSTRAAPHVATCQPTKKDKKANGRRRKSPFRDAQFMRDLQALSSGTATGFASETSVKSTPASTPSPSPSPTPTHSRSALSPFLEEALVRAVPTTSAPSPKKLAPRHPRWFEHGGMYGGVGARTYRMPTPWRDATDLLKAEYCHRALREFGPVHSFTLNLRPDIEAKARAKTNPCTWLRDRIEAELRKALGRSVQMLLAFEEAETWDESTGRFRKRLHAHGEFAVSPAEAAAARAALRRAGGEWEAVRQFQAQTLADPDEGWVGYITKGFWKTTPWMREFMKGSHFFGVTLGGNVFSATRPLMHWAQGLYERDRTMMICAQTRSYLIDCGGSE
jgi:hypothetical protein